MEHAESLVIVSTEMMAWLEKIQEEATALCAAHIDRTRKINETFGRDWSKRSILTPRVRRRGNALSLEWTEVIWIGNKVNKTRRALLKPLTKARGVAEYNQRYFASLAQEWEFQDVLALERKLIEYRKDLQTLQGILHQIRLRYRENPGRKPNQAIDEPLA